MPKVASLFRLAILASLNTKPGRSAFRGEAIFGWLSHILKRVLIRVPNGDPSRDSSATPSEGACTYVRCNSSLAPGKDCSTFFVNSSVCR